MRQTQIDQTVNVPIIIIALLGAVVRSATLYAEATNFNAAVQNSSHVLGSFVAFFFPLLSASFPTDYC